MEAKDINPALVQYLFWQSVRQATLGDQGGSTGYCPQHPRLRCSR
jgi:hypothetical protein